MFYIARKMARRRIAALVAVISAVAFGAALITTTAVLGESGLRSHPPVTRLADADVLVTAQQSVPEPGGSLIPLPERAGVPADKVDTRKPENVTGTGSNAQARRVEVALR